jgi:hypothetical protein
MRQWWAALVMVLACSAFMPRSSSAQSSAAQQSGSPAPAQSRERSKGFKLGQNYPNPFNPETTIPFAVGDSLRCSQQPGRLYRVTLRIYNLLAQEVALPVLKGSVGSVEGGRAIVNVLLPCANYEAYWDGKYKGTSREVASGIYLYRLEVDGGVAVKKMIVMK